jgi:hypothetical protein
MRRIIGQLERMNETLEGMLNFMKKPESKLARVFDIAATGVGILGILSIIDIVRNWILEGK